MAAQRTHAWHPIRVIHAVGCLGLGVLFGWYGWRHHPVRGLGARPARVAGPQVLSRELERRVQLAWVVLPDLMGGLAALGLFTLGTGIYAWKLEVWLEAHLAGEAASLRGVGLDQAALGANRDRKKGALL